MSHGPPPSQGGLHDLPPDRPGPHSSRLGLVAVIATFGGLLIGISVFLLWITNTIVTLFFPSLVDALGISTFFILAVIGAICFLFIWTMVPETRGRTLEQLERQFREKFGEGGSRGPEAAPAK